jgi:uncharacterized membrane protein HdeD (DUF308 family)
VKTDVISRILRIVFGVFLLTGGVAGCVLSFRDGDTTTGVILIVVSLIAAFYLYTGIRNKKGFGNI